MGAPEPPVSGLLDVGDGHRIFWEEHGDGEAGARPARRARARAAGPSTSSSSTCPATAWSWSTSATADAAATRKRPRRRPEREHDVAPRRRLRALREHLGIDRWLVLGGSWGSTLALAYAESYREHVSEIVAVRRHDWTAFRDGLAFRGGLSRFFPDQWARLAAPRREPVRRRRRLPRAARTTRDPEVRRRATEEWCLWESATPSWPPREGLSERYLDPDFAYAFARIVTHYVHANAWLEDNQLLMRLPTCRHPGRARERALRLPGPDRERLGAHARVARCRADGGRRRRPLDDAGDDRGGAGRDRSLQ